jgi:hypothetical protein
VEDVLDWVAFKNQFFSAVLISKQDFAANSLMTSLPQKKESGYLKQYGAKLKTFFDPTGKTPTQMELYLGPNDFRLLQKVEGESKFDKDLELQRLVYLGWPLFRIINRWFYHLCIRLVDRSEHQYGYRTDTDNTVTETDHVSTGKEELYVFGQDACAEAEIG